MKHLPKIYNLQTKATKLITLYAYLKNYKIPPNSLNDFHHRIQNTNLVHLKIAELNMYKYTKNCMHSDI